MSLVFMTDLRWQTALTASPSDTQSLHTDSYNANSPNQTLSIPNSPIPVTTFDTSSSTVSSTYAADNAASIAITANPTSAKTTSSSNVRYIAVGVILLIAVMILVPVLLRRMCRRDRRRRLTIRLVRRRSDSILQNQRGTASSSSFCVGEKSPEDQSKTNRYVNRHERKLSCVHSSGIAGIGTSIVPTLNLRYDIPLRPAIQSADETPKTNFDNPYGASSSTHLVKQRQGVAMPFNHITNLPKKALKSLELPPLASTLSFASTAQSPYHHGPSVSKLFPIGAAEAVDLEASASRTRKKSHKVSTWLVANDPVTVNANSSIALTSPSPKSHLNYLPKFNAEKNKRPDNRQGKENIYHGVNIIDDMKHTKRNGVDFMKYPVGPLVAVQQSGNENKNLCSVPVTPVSVPPRALTSAQKEWARGIAF